MANAEELYDQGLTYFGEGQHADAVRVLTEALALDPDNAEIVRALAMTNFHMTHYDEAIKWGHRLTELLPDDVLARTSLSMAYMKKGLIKEAEHEGAQARILGWKEQLKNPPPPAAPPKK